MESIFYSLGGGDEIGASCYFLSIEGYNFLLDVGIRNTNKRRYPSLSSLDKLDTIDTLNDLDTIFLSHSHHDHNGALPLLASRLINKKEVICSEKTKLLTEMQLNIIKKNPHLEEYSMYEDISTQRCIEMLKSYPVDTKINKNEYSFTLFNAGHIPGAVMTFIEFKKKKILYTGDFSNQDYPLTLKYKLSGVNNLDLLIINSTKIYKKTISEILENTYKDLNRIIYETYMGKNNIIEVDRLNHGMEVVAFLKKALEKGAWAKDGIKVYVTSEIIELIDVIKDEVNIELFKGVFKLDSKINHNEKNIVVTLKNQIKFREYKSNRITYSLHSDLKGIKELIKRLAPKNTFIVHYSKEDLNENLFKDLKKITQITFVENDKIYNF